MRCTAALLLMLAAAAPATAEPLNADTRLEDCVFRGITLAGRVRVTGAFPDFKVKRVEQPEEADLIVTRLYGSARLCGEWELAEGLAAFSVRFVDQGEDFSIYLTGSAREPAPAGR